ncbi:hypothetical protein J4233_01430 [Candidatus Pacearchaeota archaeon]|nr:hypothetical protein [Candidatus Pacearchaeota archaeon]
MDKKTGVVIVGILILMSAYLVSAGIGDWFKGITGRATTGEANATITLSGTNSVSVIIWNYTITGISAVEDTTARILFNISVTDADGAADINDSSVDINVTRASEATKVNDSCAYNGGQTATTRNYSCAFDMWYFEEAGTWTITAIANDNGNMTYIQNTSTFYYGSTQAMKISPGSLTWAGVSPGQKNQTSNNDPMLFNNTGNYMVSNLTVIGIDLIGADTSYSIGVNNLTVDIATSGACSGSACVECVVDAVSGVTMQNNTELRIVNANVTRGNHSVNDGSTGQEQLYFCMPLVPSNILSQAYTTPDEWTFTIRSYE